MSDSRLDNVFAKALGRWPDILAGAGVDSRSLDGKHHPCPACGGTDRFRYDNKNGRGDFFCNQCAAGNGIQLIERVKKCSFSDAMQFVARHLGLEQEQHLVLPVPANAPAVSFRHQELGVAIAHWPYLNAAGQLLGYVCRFEMPPPMLKQIRSRTLWEKDGKRFWRWANFTTPKPLFGLDRLADRPNAPVLVVEGEKAATAAASLMPKYVVISAYQGAMSPQTCDWSAVRGRALTIWADNDSAGMSYATTVARCATKAGALSVRIIDPCFLVRSRLTKGTPC